MGGALLVGGEDMADFVLVAVELKFVVYVQDRAAGVAEDRVHPLLQQALHQNLGGFHSHVVNLLQLTDKIGVEKQKGA